MLNWSIRRCPLRVAPGARVPLCPHPRRYATVMKTIHFALDYELPGAINPGSNLNAREACSLITVGRSRIRPTGGSRAHLRAPGMVR